MTGRFILTDPASKIAAAFNAALDPVLADNLPPRWNIAPAQPIAVIHLDDKASVVNRARQFSLMRWGFIPSWAKGETLERFSKAPLAQARGETIAEKPAFRGAWRRRRCLIPANGFYEWKDRDPDKTPYRVTPTSDGPYGAGLFTLAGIWETAYDADGGDYDTAAVITVAAGPDIAPLHHREPAVIAAADADAWLNDDNRTADAMLKRLRPASGGAWRVEAVSKAVNDARHEGPTLAAALNQQSPETPDA